MLFFLLLVVMRFSCFLFVNFALIVFSCGLISASPHSRFLKSAGLPNAIKSSMSRIKRAAADSKLGLFMPPVALYLLTSSKLHKSPLNPQAIVLHGPFFQGWLLRCIDHSQSLSFILIVGSFSKQGCSKYTEHYVFCGVQDAASSHTAEAFPGPSQVSISGGKGKSVDVLWKANGLGQFKLNSTVCTGDFSFADGTALSFSSSSRIPWKSNRFGFAGPEGWLGLTSLLPCHYFVHSVGSQCEYTVNAPSLAKHTGQGHCHIEGNHGTCFPTGWTWAQGIATNNSASFSLAVGKFLIGPIAPLSCCLYLRRSNGKTAVLRTTDLDSISYSLDGKSRAVLLQGSAVAKGFSVRLSICLSDSSAHRVSIPTCHGFSSQPGCIESYTAVASLVYLESGSLEEERYDFPLSALEFGGSFIDSLHSNINP